MFRRKGQNKSALRITLLMFEFMLLLNLIMRICNGQFPELENAVLAEPRVDCGVESITVCRVWIRMEKPFHGRLYVEDEVDQPECVHSYAKDWGSDSDGPLDSRGADFTIRFGQCNMRRQRLVIVIILGSREFFQFLKFSPLVTSIVEHEFTLPHCSYQLKQRGVDGPLMKYATIGEPITHLWQCDPIAGWLYGLLIHSCFVDDGHGKNRFDLIDERGCVTDRSLLAEISYDEKAFTAYAHTHVFRYADRIQLFFTCTIQLCFREDGGCDGISPPQCNKGKVGSPFPETPVSPSFVPIDSHEESPIFRRGHLHSKSSLSLKDSPILTINNESVIEEQLLGDTFQPSLNNHSRAGRNAALEFLNNRMETDLSADLTVVPRTSNGMAERSKDERMAGRGLTLN
ncbi:unnamed protein product [Meloidogyne enterolobii]|uniref:Uncharacterized protein n=1 Tax=Meloidogyne enterolobii TaxID=390850 RepID=A0ACB1B422_MELEN